MPKTVHLSISCSKCGKLKIKGKIFQEARSKKEPYWQKSKYNNSILLLETTQAREWSERFKVLREKNHRPRILFPVKWSFKNKGTIKPQRDKKWRDLPSVSLAWEECSRNSSEREKMIEVRNSDLHKERKRTGEWMSKGKIKTFTFIIFNSNRVLDNYSLCIGKTNGSYDRRNERLN